MQQSWWELFGIGQRLETLRVEHGLVRRYCSFVDGDSETMDDLGNLAGGDEGRLDGYGRFIRESVFVYFFLQLLGTVATLRKNPATRAAMRRRAYWAMRRIRSAHRCMKRVNDGCGGLRVHVRIGRGD